MFLQIATVVCLILSFIGTTLAQTSDIVSLKEKAEQGDANAQFKLGVRYHDGKGVPQNVGEAVKWYRKAAEQGFAEAQYNLGEMYRNGWGVRQNYVQAHMWFNFAGVNGVAGIVSANARDKLATRMTPEQIAEAQKLAREWQAAH